MGSSIWRCPHPIFPLKIPLYGSENIPERSSIWSGCGPMSFESELVLKPEHKLTRSRSIQANDCLQEPAFANGAAAFRLRSVERWRPILVSERSSGRHCIPTGATESAVLTRDS